jgi:hypothetical protein
MEEIAPQPRTKWIHVRSALIELQLALESGVIDRPFAATQTTSLVRDRASCTYQAPWFLATQTFESRLEDVAVGKTHLYG